MVDLVRHFECKLIEAITNAESSLTSDILSEFEVAIYVHQTLNNIVALRPHLRDREKLIESVSKYASSSNHHIQQVVTMTKVP